MPPYNMYALVIKPVMNLDEEDRCRAEIQTKLGDDYVVLPAGQEVSDDAAPC